MTFKTYNYFDFNDYDSWIDDFKNLFKLFDYENVLNNIETEEFIKKALKHTKQLLKNKYEYIVFYHGSATDNIYSYIDNGILPSTVESRMNYARKLFPKKIYPEITDEIFEQNKKIYLKDESYIKLNENKIYLTLDSNFFKDSSRQHYLCYGGETLGTFIDLFGEKYKSLLKEKLDAIIVKCIVPIEYLEDVLDNIIRNIVYKFFDIVLFPQKRFDDELDDNVIYISSAVKSDWIIGFTFPKDLNCS